VSAILTVFGLVAAIAGAILIMKALFWSTKTSLPSTPVTEEQRKARLFAVLDNRRIDTRLGLFLLVSGSILAAPYFMGFVLPPTALTILALILLCFVTAHSRYAKQLRATQPDRFGDVSTKTAASAAHE
jgi:hypothetical protein